MQFHHNRRRFLAGTSALCATGLNGGRSVLAEEAPLETTTAASPKPPGICIAPQYVAEQLSAPRDLQITAV